MTLGAHSQSKDTVCIPRVDAIKKLVQIENLKADSAELVLRKQEIADLNIYSNQQRTSIYSLQEHVKTIELRMLNYKDQAEIWEKSLKKQKAKTILTTVAGIGITASLTFLLIAFK
jgi:hypothetical protein